MRLFILATALFLIFFAWTTTSCLAQQEQFAGTGIQAVPVSSGEIVVLDVVADSPAAKAGLRPGDFIFQVDDFPLKGSEFEHVVRNYLWGRAGEPLTVVFLRPGRQGAQRARLVRKPLEGDVEKIPGVQLMEPGSSK